MERGGGGYLIVGRTRAERPVVSKCPGSRSRSFWVAGLSYELRANCERPASGALPELRGTSAGSAPPKACGRPRPVDRELVFGSWSAFSSTPAS